MEVDTPRKGDPMGSFLLAIKNSGAYCSVVAWITALNIFDLGYGEPKSLAVGIAHWGAGASLVTELVAEGYERIFNLRYRVAAARLVLRSLGVHLGDDNPIYIKALGDTLGYPPKATSYFASYYKMRYIDLQQATTCFQNTRVNMLYCGLQFMSHVDDLVENTHWLWDTYQYAGPMRFKLFPSKADPIQLVIPFRDQLQLRHATSNCSKWLQSHEYINQAIM